MAQSLTRMGEIDDPKAVAGESDNSVRMGGCFESLRQRRSDRKKDPEHSRSCKAWCNTIRRSAESHTNQWATDEVHRILSTQPCNWVLLVAFHK